MCIICIFILKIIYLMSSTNSALSPRIMHVEIDPKFKVTFQLAVGRWFPVKLVFHHRNHRLDMTLAVAETLSPNKPTNHIPALHA